MPAIAIKYTSGKSHREITSRRTAISLCPLFCRKWLATFSTMMPAANNTDSGVGQGVIDVLGQVAGDGEAVGGRREDTG